MAKSAYKNLIEKYDIDLVHVNTVVHRTPLIAAAELSIPCVLHIRELLTWDSALLSATGKSKSDFIEQLNSTNLLLANSKYTARSIDDTLGPFSETATNRAPIKVVTNTITVVK